MLSYFAVYLHWTVSLGKGFLLTNVETYPGMVDRSGPSSADREPERSHGTDHPQWKSWPYLKQVLKEAEATCVGEAVEAFRLKPQWSHYQLADYLREVEGHTFHKLCTDRGNNSVYPDSLGCEVYQEPKSHPEEKIRDRLWRVIHKRISNRTPEDDVVRMHLRVGDVIDASDDSVETMLTNQTFFYPDKKWWNHYVLSLDDLFKVLRHVKPQKIVLVAGAHCPDCTGYTNDVQVDRRIKEACVSCPLVKTCQYAHAMANYMTKLWYPAELRLGHDPDEDFVFLSRGSKFIPSGGSFSNLIASVVRRHHGKVYSPTAARLWYERMRTQRTSKVMEDLYVDPDALSPS